jgi:hypothetical protein
VALVVDAGSDVVDDDELVVDAVLVVDPVVTSSVSSSGSVTARAIATTTASNAPIPSQVLRVGTPIIGPRFGHVLPSTSSTSWDRCPRAKGPRPKEPFHTIRSAAVPERTDGRPGLNR